MTNNKIRGYRDKIAKTQKEISKPLNINPQS